MAQFVKRFYHKQGRPFHEIQFMTVMQCYDKKLEGFRYPIEGELMDIDLVLTTQEIQQLIEQVGQVGQEGCD